MRARRSRFSWSFQPGDNLQIAEIFFHRVPGAVVQLQSAFFAALLVSREDRLARFAGDEIQIILQVLTTLDGGDPTGQNVFDELLRIFHLGIGQQTNDKGENENDSETQSQFCSNFQLHDLSPWLSQQLNFAKLLGLNPANS
jgi:hypothetical protein